MCHQSVGLLQREIEERGIRTASVMHVPNLAMQIKPPRMFIVDAPLGCTFSKPYDFKQHRNIVLDVLDFAMNGGNEDYFVSPYVWDDENGGLIKDEDNVNVNKQFEMESSAE